MKESEAERKHKSATVPGSPHAKKSKTVFDSGFQVQIPDFLSVKLGFQIPILNRFDCYPESGICQTWGE